MGKAVMKTGEHTEEILVRLRRVQWTAQRTVGSQIGVTRVGGS